MERIEDIFTITLEESKLKYEANEFLLALLDTYKELLSKYEIDFSDELKYHPAMAWSIYRDPENVELLKENLSISEQDKSWFNSINDNDWVSRSLDILSESNSKDLNREIVLKMNVPTTEECELINRALSIIEKAWPEAYKQIKLLSKKIVVIDSNGDNFTSATGAYSFGAIFLKNKPGWNAMNFVDVLIHESGHQALMVKQTFGRMIENLTKKADSPLREDKRWLNGTLHATYVLWRVLKVFSKIKESEVVLFEEEKITMDNLEKEFILRLEKGVEILENEAEFSNLGKIFFDEIKQELSEFLLIYS